jgi:FecR protein
MRWAVWVMSASVLCTPLAVRPAAAEPQIGAVAMAEYKGAIGTRESGEKRDLTFQQTVYANERVETGVASETNLAFLDQTNLFIGERSTVLLDRFVYDPGSRNGDVAISLMKGAFRFVTGEIKNKRNVMLRTPTASITIRGTVLVLFMLADGTSEINVWSGAVDVIICDRPGPVPVNAGESLTVSSSCEGRRGRARNTGEVGYPIPRLPRDYAAIDYVVPAAGDAEPEQPPETTEEPAYIPPPSGNRGSDRDGSKGRGGGGYQR